jgi:hypothetical protein
VRRCSLCGRRRAASRPYKYSHPGLEDREWGVREMVVYDGFGNRIIFYRPLK